MGRVWNLPRGLPQGKSLIKNKKTTNHEACRQGSRMAPIISFLSLESRMPLCFEHTDSSVRGTDQLASQGPLRRRYEGLAQAPDLQDCVSAFADVCLYWSGMPQVLFLEARQPIATRIPDSPIVFQKAACSNLGVKKKFGFTFSLSLSTLECSFYQLCQIFIFQMESSSRSFSRIHWVKRQMYVSL